VAAYRAYRRNGDPFAPLSDGKRFLVLENTGRSEPAQIGDEVVAA
jgi:hypothetical protein